MDEEHKLELPQGALIGFRSVYTLNTLNEKTGRLRVLYYACCLVYGPNPMWGLWDKKGKFVRFYGLKSEIEKAYHHLSLRRVMARWSIVDLAKENADLKRRIAMLEEKFGAKAVRGQKSDAAARRADTTRVAKSVTH